MAETISWTNVKSQADLELHLATAIMVDSSFQDWGKHITSKQFRSLEAIDLSRVQVGEEEIAALGRTTEIKVIMLPSGTKGELVRKLSNLKNVKEISLPGTFAHAGDICWLCSSLEQLESLNLAGSLFLQGRPFKGVSRSQLRQLSIARCTGITTEGIEDLSIFKDLRGLNLANCNVADPTLRMISTMNNLEWLSISNCTQVSGNGIAHLSSLAKLATLDVSYLQQIPRAGWSTLSKCSSLQDLNVGRTTIPDEVVGSLLRSISLQSLDLSSCPDFTGVCLAAKDAKVAQLKTLKIANCPLDSKALHGLISSSVETLDLTGINSVNEGMATDLMQFANLKILILARSGFSNFVELGTFASKDTLERVDVSFSLLTDLGMKQLCQCKNIREIKISGCGGLSSAAFQNLTNLSKLQAFDCAGCLALSGSDFDFIESCTRLEIVRLDGIGKLGTTAISNFSKLPRLRGLSVRNCGAISDEEIGCAGKCASLQVLEINGCEIGEAALKSLRTSRPDILIYGP